VEGHDTISEELILLHIRPSLEEQNYMANKTPDGHEVTTDLAGPLMSSQ